VRTSIVAAVILSLLAAPAFAATQPPPPAAPGWFDAMARETVKQIQYGSEDQAVEAMMARVMSEVIDAVYAYRPTPAPVATPRVPPNNCTANGYVPGTQMYLDCWKIVKDNEQADKNRRVEFLLRMTGQPPLARTNALCPAPNGVMVACSR
jgi:hypothetical protein